MFVRQRRPVNSTPIAAGFLYKLAIRKGRRFFWGDVSSCHRADQPASIPIGPLCPRYMTFEWRRLLKANWFCSNALNEIVENLQVGFAIAALFRQSEIDRTVAEASVLVVGLITGRQGCASVRTCLSLWC